MHRHRISTARLAAMAMGGLLLGASARAATITVTTNSDEVGNNGACSLREAVKAASTKLAVDTCVVGTGDDVIVLAAGTYDLTSALTVDSAVTIQGASASTTILDARERSGVIRVPAGGNLTLRNLTVTNGVADEGGGIYNSGRVAVDACTISHNRAIVGGGISSTGALEVTGSLITGNEARGGDGMHGGSYGRYGGGGGGAGLGGGVYVNGGMAQVTSTFITDNTARGGNGGNANGSQTGAGGRFGGGKGGYNVPGEAATGLGSGGGGAGGGPGGHWTVVSGGSGSFGGGNGGHSTTSLPCSAAAAVPASAAACSINQARSRSQTSAS